MAFMEGKLQMIDLIGALSAKRQQEQTKEERERQALQNQMMRQQMDASKKEADLKMSLLTSPFNRPGTHHQMMPVRGLAISGIGNEIWKIWLY